jgi:hypothetical protein
MNNYKRMLAHTNETENPYSLNSAYIYAQIDSNIPYSPQTTRMTIS